MHVRGVFGLVFLLILLGASPAAAESSAHTPTVDTSTHSADIDLGPAVLDHGDIAAGPFIVAAGLFDRVTVGTYTLPWLVAAASPAFTDDSTTSIAPNVFGRIHLSGHENSSFSVSIDAALFYGRLGDIDGDGLKLRALAIPMRLLIGKNWNRRHDTTLELAAVYSQLTGEHSLEGDTWVNGLALAHSSHIGATHRLRLTRGFSVWARARTLIGHAPVRASFDSELSEDLDLNVEARANAAELSSGFTGSAGIHLGEHRWGLTAGAGWGTWFVPGLRLPVSRSLPFAEFNVYWRF